jgi:beta-phosphoglucomutase-like phosphatase (HAD superfamily)
MVAFQPVPKGMLFDLGGTILREVDYQPTLGIVSNAMFSARVLEWELSQHGFGDVFQFVMSSADYGFQKPHPAIFNAAPARLGLQPREVWFVGDDYHNDVNGARGSGMNVVWYNPSQAPAADDCPTQWISDWANFPESVASSRESPNPTHQRDSGSSKRKMVSDVRHGVVLSSLGCP